VGQRAVGGFEGSEIIMDNKVIYEFESLSGCAHLSSNFAETNVLTRNNKKQYL
jgi:hypothetical protein